MRKKLFPHSEFDSLNDRLFVKDNVSVHTNAFVAHIENTDLADGVYDLNGIPFDAEQERLEVHGMIEKQLNALDTDSTFTIPRNKYLLRGTTAIRFDDLPDYIFSREHIALLFRHLAGKTYSIRTNSKLTPGYSPVLITVSPTEQFLVMPRKKVDSTDEIEEIK